MKSTIQLTHPHENPRTFGPPVSAPRLRLELGAAQPRGLPRGTHQQREQLVLEAREELLAVEAPHWRTTGRPQKYGHKNLYGTIPEQLIATQELYDFYLVGG